MRSPVPALALVCALLLSTQGALADDRPRSLEAQLLHLRPNLSEIEIWNRAARTWQPLAVPRGKVLVVHLWARSCLPCLKEFPLLARLAKSWAAQPDVVPLFVADGPEEMTRAKVEEFWQHPYVDLPGENCPGQTARLPGSGSRCPLDVPELDPARTRSPRLGRELNAQVKPLTLFIDPRGFVRQAFVGSIAERAHEVTASLERLLRAVASERTGSASGPAHPRKS